MCNRTLTYFCWFKCNNDLPWHYELLPSMHILFYGYKWQQWKTNRSLHAIIIHIALVNNTICALWYSSIRSHDCAKSSSNYFFDKFNQFHIRFWCESGRVNAIMRHICKYTINFNVNQKTIWIHVNEKDKSHNSSIFW